MQIGYKFISSQGSRGFEMNSAFSTVDFMKDMIYELNGILRFAGKWE